MQVMVTQPTAARSIALYLEGMWGKTGINCFVLITGWFMCKSHITARKFLKLLLEILFYNITINAVFGITSYHHYSLTDYVFNVWPLWDQPSGFISCYLIFFLFIPYINILIHNLSRHQHFLLIVLCVAVYCFLPRIKGGPTVFDYITWFTVLYFISSYLRLYNFKGEKIYVSGLLPQVFLFFLLLLP